MLPDIPAAWVTAGSRGVIALYKRRRLVSWNSPPDEVIAAVIAAVRPLIEAEVREEIAAVVEGLGVPGVARMACEDAAAAVRKGSS